VSLCKPHTNQVLKICPTAADMSLSSPDGAVATGTANIASYWQVTFDETLASSREKVGHPWPR
jgi:hypothetical protein